MDLDYSNALWRLNMLVGANNRFLLTDPLMAQSYLTFWLSRGEMDALTYFEYWYPLPTFLPFDIKFLIYEFFFDPAQDPW